MTEVHRAAVEGADFGEQLAYVIEPFGGARHIGSNIAERQRLLGRANGEVTTHTRGEVDDHIS